MALTFIPGAPTIATRAVASPVTGRWLAVNSPATRIPSHVVHSLGQTFAIDLVYDPQPGTRPAFGKGRALRPPTDFPAFGQPVFAPAAGRVVAVRDSAHDHRSRSSWSAIIYMMVLEATIRELAGPRHVLGNHIVLDLGGRTFAVLAHLRHRSATVCVGQQVQAGQLLGRCGNTGNSSEPHVHFQLMDHPRVLLAAGLPFVFTNISINGSAPQQAIPATNEIMLSSGPGLSRP
jgi:murein DD-endopeptidase MepM/ murein hydrolase activator NlpD